MPSLRLPAMTLDGTSLPLETDPGEINRFYIPLARFLLDRMADRPRFLVGIGGLPACGKSSLTQLLSAVVNALAGNALAVHVGLDGWHFPNSYLETHTILRNGSEIPLLKVKGSPDSFNASSLLAFLRSVRQGRNPAYPFYNRVLHDPQPGGQILSSHRLILVEGNYLLLDTPPWSDFEELFDLAISVTAARDISINSLIERHLRGGKPPAVARAHLVFSDLPNLDIILNHSRPADIIVEKKDSRRISKIIYP